MMAVDGSDVKDNQKAKENLSENGTPANDSEPSELESKIIAQIEYYFGDINLPKDKFMLEKIKMDDGWIPMSVMMTFQRLAKLTTDAKVVAKALVHSDLMEVDESGSEIKIRRLPEFPIPEFDDARRMALLERSIYCARFPQDTPIDALLSFFKPYGPIDNIIMRKYKDKVSKTKKFKGSVFVTFETKERGQEFLELESVKYQDVELTRKWQLKYHEDKRQELLENKLKRSKKKEDEAEEAEEDVQTIDNFPRGAIIHFTGDFTGITRESIRDKLTELGFEPAYIEFKMGKTEAHVRFSEENAGKNFLEKVGSEVIITNQNLKPRLLEGDEEKTFLETAAKKRNSAMKRHQLAKKIGKKSKKGKGNKGSGGGRKRRRKETEKEESGKDSSLIRSPPAKKILEN